MNPNSKSRLEDLENVRKFRSQQRNLSPEKEVESKLVHLQLFIQQLGQKISGKAELKRRFERFGDCKRMPGEFTPQFYGRLRRWLDQDIED